MIKIFNLVGFKSPVTLVIGMLLLTSLSACEDKKSIDFKLVTPLVVLKTNPDNFDGKVVRTLGYFYNRREGGAVLYLDEIHGLMGFTEAGVYLSLTEEQKALSRENNYNGKIVAIEGEFKVRGYSFFNHSGAQISQISDMALIKESAIESMRRNFDYGSVSTE